MGMLYLDFTGSFKTPKFYHIKYSAGEYGHADAVEKAIKHLKEVSLPEAINIDVKLGLQNDFPEKGFSETSKQALGTAQHRRREAIKDIRKEYRDKE